MSSNERSKLLKDKDKEKEDDKYKLRIIFSEDIIDNNKSKNDISEWIMVKINDNIVIIFLLLILIFLTLIYLLLVSMKEKKEIETDYDNSLREDYLYNNNEGGSFKKAYKPLNISNLYNVTKMCTENKQFAILKRTSCEACGLFSYYIVHLGCIITYLNEGYIPIINVGSFSNIFNGYNETTNKNQWELFFNQPCGYTLNYVKNNINKDNIKYFECECNDNMPSEKEVYSNKTRLKFFRDMAKRYMSVKDDILNEANDLWGKLFNNSKNVLGLLVRGTDYISIKPFEHAIPPSVDMAINDTIKWDNENKYDYIFLATEDNNIRKEFIKNFGAKLKYLLPNTTIEYNYEEAYYLSFYDDVYGNMNFHKTYLLSMILLSKCLDVITSRTSGAAGAYVLSQGFRKDLVYYIGEYNYETEE